MIPILFDTSETAFDSYGLGALRDASACTVTMEGAQYELKMDYPVEGAHFADIARNRLILAKPCQTDEPQPFRIYRITKPTKGGKVTAYARHISYDLSGIPVLPFTATSAADFAAKIKQNAAVACPFTFETDVDKEEELKILYPHSARSLLSEDEDSWQEIYGGELAFDRYKVKLLQSAGADRGLVIRYGVDLVDARMEESLADACTGILPYYWDEPNNTLVVGSVLPAPGSFDHTRILPIDVTEYIVEGTQSAAKVNEVGQMWLDENLPWLPEISMTLSYAQIHQTLRLHDTVTVQIERLGVDVKAKVSSTTWDVLRDRYESVNVGDVRESLSSDIWDASRLKHGLLDLRRIKDGSIGGRKLGGGSIGSRELADWSVIRQKLGWGAVGTAQLDDAAVTLTKCGTSITGFFTGANTFTGLRVNSRAFWIDGHAVYRDAAGNLITEN